MCIIYLYICVYLKFNNFFILIFAEICKPCLFFNKFVTFVRVIGIKC